LHILIKIQRDLYISLRLQSFGRGGDCIHPFL